MAADQKKKDEEDGKSDDAVVSPNYKGPSDDFPFRAFRTTGFIHLTLGLMVQFLAIIQLSLGERHRDIFLQFAAAPLWCPIPVIAVGVLGICMSRKRYWEVRCMKVCFGVLSLINAFLFMVLMGSLVGFYGFYYYSVSDYEPAEVEQDLRISESSGYTVMVTLVLVIAGVEVLVSIFSFFICCCCAQVKRPNEAKKAGPTPKHIPSVKLASQAAAPVAAPAAGHLGNHVQYGVLMPPGSPSQGSVILSPGGSGYPAGTFMMPPPLVAPGAPQNTPETTARTHGRAKNGKKGSKEPNIKVTKKNEKKKKVEKKKEKKEKTKQVNNPEKSAPTFSIQVPEYMRANQSPVVHGNGVPYGFISSSVPNGGGSAAIPSFTTSPPPPPPSYAAGYSPTYDYYSNVSHMH